MAKFLKRRLKPAHLCVLITELSDQTAWELRCVNPDTGIRAMPCKYILIPQIYHAVLIFIIM